MNVRCKIAETEAGDFLCGICLTRGASAGAVACPMGDVDTSHQRRGDPTPAAEVSEGPATATEALVEALVEPAAPNVVSIKTPRNLHPDVAEIPGGPVNKELVESLERYLQEAKSGQVIAMAFAGIRPPSDGPLQSTFSSWNTWHKDVHIGLMLGNLHWLMYRLAKSYDGGEEQQRG